MCGLIGFSGNRGKKFDVSKIATLFMYNLERGQDATGFWTPKSGNIKSLEKASKFLNKEFKKIEPDCVLIGHVRAGSTYKNFITAAHPFEGEKCVLAHNGTLTNSTYLANHYKIASNGYNTDTDLLHKILEENFGSKILSQIDGTASLLIHDKNAKLKKGQENSTLFAFRLTHDRPLYYGFSPEGIYFSSMEEGLDFIGCEDIKQFDVGKLYTISEGKLVGEGLTIPSRPIKYTPINNYYGNNYTPASQNATPQTITYPKPSDSAMRTLEGFLGQWLQADNPFDQVGKPSIVKDKWYRLVRINYISNTCDVVNTDKESITNVPLTKFYYTQKVTPLDTCKTKKVVVMAHIVKTTDEKFTLFNIGDVVDVTSTSEITDATKGIQVSIKSLVTGESYVVKKSWLRAALFSEQDMFNVENNNIYKTDSVDITKTESPNIENLPKEEDKDNLAITQESYLYQFMVESGFVTGDELLELATTTDLEEGRKLFDLAEDYFVALNEMEDAVNQNAKFMTSIYTVTELKDKITELKEKIAKLYNNSIDICHKIKIKTLTV